MLFDGGGFCVGLWHSKLLREAGSRSPVTPAILRPPQGGSRQGAKLLPKQMKKVALFVYPGLRMMVAAQ